MRYKDLIMYEDEYNSLFTDLSFLEDKFNFYCNTVESITKDLNEPTKQYLEELKSQINDYIFYCFRQLEKIEEKNKLGERQIKYIEIIKE